MLRFRKGKVLWKSQHTHRESKQLRNKRECHGWEVCLTGGFCDRREYMHALCQRWEKQDVKKQSTLENYYIFGNPEGNLVTEQENIKMTGEETEEDEWRSKADSFSPKEMGHSNDYIWRNDHTGKKIKSTKSSWAMWNLNYWQWKGHVGGRTAVLKLLF